LINRWRSYQTDVWSVRGHNDKYKVWGQYAKACVSYSLRISLALAIRFVEQFGQSKSF